MTNAAATASLEFPCPKCGYDLRATPWDNGRRCPECGTVSRSNVRSHIPWVHRRHRGRIRAFLATIRMVLSRPGTLAREPWINPTEARRFHHVALWIGTIAGTLLLVGTFLIRGDHWRETLAAKLPTESGGPHNLDFPINALTDSLWIALPLAVTLYVASALCMWFYRIFLRFASGRRRHRERLRRIGWYASATLPVTLILLGGLAMGGMPLYEESDWLNDSIKPYWIAGLWVLGFAVVAGFYFTTMRLVWMTGRWRVARTVLMFPIFPYVAMVIFAGVGMVVFWAVGYAAIAIWSMIH